MYNVECTRRDTKDSLAALAAFLLVALWYIAIGTIMVRLASSDWDFK